MPPRGWTRPGALLLALGAALTCAQRLPAQMPAADTLRPPARRLFSAGFDKNINTWLWDLQGAIPVRGEGWDLLVADRFRSSIIRTDRNLIRDENSFDLDGSLSLVPTLEGIGRVNSYIFSDQRSIALNSLSGHGALAGVRWTPIEELAVTPLAGYKFDNQLGVQDRGFMYAGDAELRPLAFGTLTASGTMHAAAEYLDPRLQEERRIFGQLLASISPEADNRTLVEYRRLRRDYYLPADDAVRARYGVDHPVETRDEELFGAGDQLQYRISRPLVTNIAIDFTQRTIAKLQKYKITDTPLPVFDEDISEFRLNGIAGLLFDNGAGTRGEFRAILNERNESYALRRGEGIDPVAFARQEKSAEQKNNLIHQSQLSLNLLHAPGAGDTLTLSGATVKLRYDTPSDANDDDRDELFFALGAGWVHRFDERLTGRILAETNLRHTVYIFAERSANNLWNRVFRLATAAEYRAPRRFYSKTDAEVIANYSVYDFEDITQSVQSFSLRQMTISDSASLRIGGAIWLNAVLQLRLYERGELYWNVFRLRPLDYFDERTIVLSVSYDGGWFRVAPGARLFFQDRYGYDGLRKRLTGRLSNAGPTCRADILFPSGSRVFIDGWYQFTKETGGEVRRVPNLTMNVVWNL